MSAFLTENAGLVCFTIAQFLSTLMAVIYAWRNGHETACREFAARAIRETRSQTSERL